MIIRIKNLRLQTILGVHDRERERPRDVVINAHIEFDGQPSQSDRIEDTLDYESLTQRMTQFVEGSRFFLLEKLSEGLLQLIIEDPRVLKARVEVDKPHALPLTDSVSVESSFERKRNP